MGVKDNKLLIISLVAALFIILMFRLFSGSDLANQIIYFLNVTAIFIIIIYYLIKKQIKNNQKTVFLILMIALIFKLIVMISLHNMISFPDETRVYDLFSWRQTQTWRGNDDFQIRDFENISNSRDYFYFIAIVYYVFGHSIIIAKMFNVFFSVLGALLLYIITQEIFNKKSISIIALILVLFSPSITFWTSPLLRESFNLFFITLSFFFAVKLIKTLKLRYFLYLLLPCSIIWNTRFYIAIITIFTILCYITANIIFKKKISKSVIPFIFLIFIIFINMGLVQDFDSIYKLDLDFKKLDWQRKHTVYGNYAFLEGEDISTFRNALVFLPKGLQYFFFSPFLRDLKSNKELLALPDTLMWYCLLPFVIYGLFIGCVKKKSIDAFFLAVYCILVILLYSLIDGNVWLLHRHKIQATQFLLIFGAAGLHYCLEYFNFRKIFKAHFKPIR